MIFLSSEQMRIKKEIYWQHFYILKEISAQLAKFNEMENLPIMPKCVPSQQVCPIYIPDDASTNLALTNSHEMDYRACSAQKSSLGYPPAAHKRMWLWARVNKLTRGMPRKLALVRAEGSMIKDDALCYHNPTIFNPSAQIHSK